MGELMIPDQALTLLTGTKEIGEVLKPLTREIYLYDTYIAGTMYLSDPSVLKELSVGQKLKLKREDNKFDEKAILVLTESGKKTGYVPRRHNTIFSRLMDAGKLLSATVTDIKVFGEELWRISIAIYLIDF